MTQLIKQFQNDIRALCWLAMALLLACSLWSFYPLDPSFNSTGKGQGVINLCGLFGAYLSDALYQLMGLSAWLLVLACTWASLSCFVRWQHNNRPWALSLLWCALLLMTCSGLGNLHWPGLRLYEGYVSFGGLLGLIVTKGLIEIFNFVGSAIILWSAALVLIIFYTESSFADWGRLGLRILTRPHKAATTLWKAFKNSRQHNHNLTPNTSVDTPNTTSETPEDPAFNKPLLSQMGLTFEEDPRFEEQKFQPEQEGFFNISKPQPPHKHSLHEQPPHEPQFNEEHGDKAQIKIHSMATPSAHSIDETSSASKPTGSGFSSAALNSRPSFINWRRPKLALLIDPPAGLDKVNNKELLEKSQRLIDKLAQFNIRGQVVGVKPGPAVTLFEFKPEAHIKVSRITDLADDLSLAMSSESVRIIAPIPGRDVVGIETSNQVQKTVYLKNMISCRQFWNLSLPVALGCEANGQAKIVELRKMPHLLIAGSTGSGKSVFVTTLLTGLLFRHSPESLRLIIIDPKQVDLVAFSKLPHLLMPLVTESRKAIGALRWAVSEMDKRYRSMAKLGARNLDDFNIEAGKLTLEQKAQHQQQIEAAGGAASAQSYYYTPQPYVVIVVEEFGDLMAIDKQNVEGQIVRLAQMARACGMHLILAMQSPRKDVVTGLIKTNIPGRISFKVASKMDSRIILDEGGAERLLSRGDMLFLAPGVSKPERHHGPWLTDDEIQSVCDFWQEQAEPDFVSSAIKAVENHEATGDTTEQHDNNDPMYDDIARYVAQLKVVSTSLIQRRFRLGYPRAARLVELLEQKGVIGPALGAKPREVLKPAPRPSLP